MMNNSIIRIFLHILGNCSFYANNFINKFLNYLYSEFKSCEFNLRTIHVHTYALELTWRTVNKSIALLGKCVCT